MSQHNPGLIENLQRLSDILLFCVDEVRYIILRAHLSQTQDYLALLENTFTSGLEVEISYFLRQDVHPVLDELLQKYPPILGNAISSYFELLDSDLGIIFDKRRSYEEAVRLLNQKVLSHLIEEDKKMQSILPHYFEHFKTDGIEYNIYLGASITPGEAFSIHYLNNFRLWQLVHLSEITRLVAQMQDELPASLTTAQLIFVYGSTVSIRFRMDEKKFDVDGAYNVGYEIIKKRIDKAIVKGTNERLTLTGKIAIVYMQDRDRREYVEYFRYLQREQYITNEIEDLELEEIAGAEGLKALRITVITK